MADTPQEFSEQNDTLTPPWIEAEGIEVEAPLPPEEPVEAPSAELTEEVIAASQPYVGKWNTLVSTTNWEKGKIITQWREEVLGDDADSSDRTDEAWSRLVGDVSPQHVGRLRRVYARFGKTQSEYTGLYWSHFLAALDWDDAEMWLEGAQREKWSIKQMTAKRFETITSTRTAAGEVTHETITREASSEAATADSKSEKAEYGDEFDPEASGPAHEGPDFGEETERGAPRTTSTDPVIGGEVTEVEAASSVDDGPPLLWQQMPPDLAESMEAVKLAIIKHKLGGWTDVSLEAVLNNLEFLARIARSN